MLIMAKDLIQEMYLVLRRCERSGISIAEVLSEARKKREAEKADVRLSPEFKFEMARVNAMHWSMREEYTEGHMSPADAVEANVRKNFL